MPVSAWAAVVNPVGLFRLWLCRQACTFTVPLILRDAVYKVTTGLWRRSADPAVEGLFIQHLKKFVFEVTAWRPGSSRILTEVMWQIFAFLCAFKDYCSLECSECCAGLSVCEQCIRLGEMCDCRLPAVGPFLAESCSPASVSKPAALAVTRAPAQKPSAHVWKHSPQCWCKMW